MDTVFSVLAPQGLIAEKELALFADATALMLITAVAVFALAFFFAWRYRASNTRAVYMPDWEHGAMNELIWWAIPIEIVLVLGALTWSSTHDLDPWRPLNIGGEPLVVEVVALPWKWLFIYPEEGIASVNELYLPTSRPIDFRITADAPMNAFWIPQLGGMIYAMTGMVTELHLVANNAGVYAGSSSNYSGAGFADMKFLAHALSPDDFDAWASETRSGPALTTEAYAKLAEPSRAEPPRTYGGVVEGLQASVVAKYMSHPRAHAH